MNAKGAQIGIWSDNGKIVINGGSVTASGGNKAITTKEEEASAGNNDITTVKNANPVLWLGLILLGLAGIGGLAVSKVRK